MTTQARLTSGLATISWGSDSDNVALHDTSWDAQGCHNRCVKYRVFVNFEILPGEICIIMRVNRQLMGKSPPSRRDSLTGMRCAFSPYSCVRITVNSPLIILAHEGGTNTGCHSLREKRVKDAPFELVRGIIAPVFPQWICAHICIPLMSKYDQEKRSACFQQILSFFRDSVRVREKSVQAAASTRRDDQERV